MGDVGMVVERTLCDSEVYGVYSQSLHAYVRPPQVPGPTPPSPPPSLCPRPPPGSDLKCSFKDNTTIQNYEENSYSRVDVPANNYSACCHACTSNASCHVALMTHGPKNSDIDFCWFYKKNSSQLRLHHVGEACPNLSFMLFAP